MAEAQDGLADVIADPLVLGAVHGDRAAWFQLTLHIEAWVEEHVPRHWRMRKARLAGSEDDVRDVAGRAGGLRDPRPRAQALRAGLRARSRR